MKTFKINQKERFNTYLTKWCSNHFTLSISNYITAINYFQCAAVDKILIYEEFEQLMNEKFINN